MNAVGQTPARMMHDKAAKGLLTSRPTWRVSWPMPALKHSRSSLPQPRPPPTKIAYLSWKVSWWLPWATAAAAVLQRLRRALRLQEPLILTLANCPSAAACDSSCQTWACCGACSWHPLVKVKATMFSMTPCWLFRAVASEIKVNVSNLTYLGLIGTV